MREYWEDLKVALREMFQPARDDEPDTTTAEVIARWVGEHKHPPPEGG